ncbi:transposase [Streptomyces cyaneofuscatus]|uniref:transposase n=1 Tax=Streptomyces cyaneofuscatus TaxID=66883 RepID=UPI0036DAB750
MPPRWPRIRGAILWKVAIDMSTSYRAAVHIGVPHATIVVDHFHVVSAREQDAQHGAPSRRRHPYAVG